jgi:hypothetical protein
LKSYLLDEIEVGEELIVISRVSQGKREIQGEKYLLTHKVYGLPMAPYIAKLWIDEQTVVKAYQILDYADIDKESWTKDLIILKLKRVK